MIINTTSIFELNITERGEWFCSSQKNTMTVQILKYCLLYVAYVRCEGTILEDFLKIKSKMLK